MGSSKKKKQAPIIEIKQIGSNPQAKDVLSGTQKKPSFFEKIRSYFEKSRAPTDHTQVLKNLKTAAYYGAGIVALVAIFLVIDLHSDQRTYPRSWVGPIYVGYLKEPEARTKVENTIEQYLKTPLTFELEGKSITASPQELGMNSNANHVINALPIFQFTKSIPGKFISFIWEKYNAPLQFSIDGDKALQVLENKFNLTGKRAHNAKLIPEKKKLVIAPETSGMVLDRAVLLKNLENTAAHLGNDVIQVHLVAEEPNIKVADIAPLQDHITSVVGKPIRLWYGGKKWKIEPSAHVDALSFEQEQTIEFKNIPFTLPIVLTQQDIAGVSNQNYTIHKISHLALDPKIITPFLNEKIIASINRPTSDVKISKDEKGKVVIEGNGQNGVTVPPIRLVNSLNLAMNNEVGHVEVPIYEMPSKSEISPDLQAMGIHELISTGHTTFYGSPPNRIYNIKLGIQKYNGLIIQPGETFSFNKYIGQVDARSGFLPEKVIKENKIELEFGGGICQVSTTAYRAALFAGMPMEERAPHSIKVAYYAQVLGHGLDATIYPGTHDLKFTNNTPGAILIQAYEDDQNAYFKFYGTSDGRKVYLDGPYGGGLHYQWVRHIIKDDKETKETIVSNYKTLAVPPPPPTAPAVADTNQSKPTVKPTAAGGAQPKV